MKKAKLLLELCRHSLSNTGFKKKKTLKHKENYYDVQSIAYPSWKKEWTHGKPMTTKNPLGYDGFIPLILARLRVSHS